MNTTERTYIGNGRQKPGSEYITLSLCLEDLLAQEAVERNGKHYLRAVVARRRSSDAYGRTHSVYVPQRPDEQELLELQRNQVADQQELEAQRCAE